MRVMDASEMVMMEESFDRIIIFFAAIFRWILSVLRLNKPLVIENIKPIVKYGDKYKSDFLRTYREEEEVDWNSNIDSEIDAEKLAEELTDTNNEYEKKWRSRILIENTPRGNVIMFYDLYKRAFSYYCDSGAMPYDIMNAVAMKYVVMFRCRDFFVDSHIVPKPVQEDPPKKETETRVPFSKPEPKLNLDKQAFVKLKSYNTATKKAGVSKEDDKVINCFLHLGASRNWAPITKRIKANPLNGFKTDMIPGSTNNNKMSYLEYKRLRNNNAK
jgi:hypothetical protein